MFDKTFFKFLIAFVLIIGASLAVIGLVNGRSGMAAGGPAVESR